MRILYLSMSREQYASNYFPFLRRYVDDVARGEFQVHVASLPDRLC